MDDLIAALTIFRKYKNSTNPTCCIHDTLLISDVTRDEVSIEDTVELERLGFRWSEGYDCFISYRFGSA